MEDQIRILGIETSCDETGVAVYCSKNGVLSHALFSQIDLHKKFGGVVPEIAARTQLEKITPMVSYALEQAHIYISEITAIAVTHKPGLPSSLLVGVCFAKALSYALQKPILGINHLEGHIFSSFLEHKVPFPHICLTASGGHTALYYVEDFGVYRELGSTCDDAAGEAFDKIAKLLELEYPGGPVIERLAREAQFHDALQYPRGKQVGLDFSFSGLKTAVLYDLIKRGVYDRETRTLHDKTIELKRTVASSLLVCIADIFEQKIERAVALYPHIAALTFVGGVACNKYIKERLSIWCKKRNILFYSPSPSYCTDNGAMIAFVGAYRAQKKMYDDMSLDIM
jgi:N6-L-threonylcarbamoyladenine synthase